MWKKRLSKQIKDCAQRLEPCLRRILTADCCADAEDAVERAAHRVIDAYSEALLAAKILDDVGL
ncbi:hypothetical protein [Stomatobaculum longum]|uniref:hypothetical protein n=1 Tax=Stomatobaculum longum TaxID=796942 RepID=UPI0028DC1042|nr:hypothetical protein [Stomatobaculum longum]